MSDHPVRTPRHRGIYLLPNLFTTGAMFAGYYAILASIDGRFTEAAVAVFIAALLDGMDGRVARLTGTQSEFGVQYDSLSDLVSFGLAPSLVLYDWSLTTLKAFGPLWGKVGWASAFLYATCAALRLARFNTQVGVADKRYFQGLASPAAAAVCMSFVWTMEKFGVPGGELCFLTPILAVVVGLLMVSRFRYYSFKALPMGQGERIPFWWVVVLVLVLVLLYLDPPTVLLTVFSLYLLSGPVVTLWGIATRRRARRGSSA
ncbi:CDP-diacylglycerol--serine O-phosphatidyltransferase [Aerosticca soli]|uniref:CDP-diacylglycerol--serine O-phosphatidyltransferase n=1 Tax=Aerosticca soli TaxID=2010829 RepID=A0A2Z6E5G9_9GAMM|nr:CDP-diacylglycerol--serine O-phosphatidyltransferase [Aerosticca soli]MDI3261815.1 CDP-diacylglycerol--serine O-phosphatidyltransferase [Fulvimonas sp.]BBD79719.1 CDP-diacylglycerol--serine O-phosphatidyltransferase [Aerosticca soli]